MVELLDGITECFAHSPYSKVATPPRASMPFVSVVVGGKRLVKLELGERISLPAALDAKQHVAISTPNAPLGSLFLELRTRFGTRKHILKRDTPFCIVIRGWVTISASAFRRGQETTTVSDVALVNLVDCVLQNEMVNPRKGALSSETLKCIASRRETAHFRRAIAQYGSWEGFLRHHRHAFTVFSYSSKELKCRKLQEQISPADLRVVRNEKKKYSLTAAPFEGTLIDQICEELHGVEDGLPAFRILRQCSQTKTSLHQSCGSFSLMMRFLQKHKKAFQWTTDPSKKTVVSIIGVKQTEQQKEEKIEEKTLIECC